MFAVTASAKVGKDIQVQLNSELMPFSAIRAGNAKEIPAWRDTPEMLDGEKALFIITQDNNQQYLEKFRVFF